MECVPPLWSAIAGHFWAGGWRQRTPTLLTPLQTHLLWSDECSPRGEFRLIGNGSRLPLPEVINLYLKFNLLLNVLKQTCGLLMLVT